MQGVWEALGSERTKTISWRSDPLRVIKHDGLCVPPVGTHINHRLPGARRIQQQDLIPCRALPQLEFSQLLGLCYSCAIDTEVRGESWCFQGVFKESLL